jgi:hypothetical protein
MINKKKLPKYGFGSVLQAASPFLNLIPGVGTIASLGASAVGGLMEKEEQEKELAKKNIKYTPMNITTNPYGIMRNGGNTQLGNSKQYNAPTHENGGQPINENGDVDFKNPTAEIEGTENKYKYSKVNNKSYVFSDKNGTSDLIKSIFEKYKNKNVDKDFTSKAAMEMEIKRIESLNEKIKALKESSEPKQEEMTETPQMGGGGNVITMRKEQDNQKRLFQYGDGGEDGVPDGVPFQLGLNNPAYQGQPMYENPSPFKLRIQNHLNTIPSYVSTQPSLDKIAASMVDPSKGQNYNPLSVKNIKPPSNGNIADVLKGGLALYDVAKAANAKPEIVDPRLTDYNKSDNQLYSQNVDLTAANNQSQAAANQGVSQVNDASMSNSVRMSRLQGVNANFQENAGKLALQAQGMKNAINQNLGQYEGNKAVDNANRLTAADEKFAMNKAAARSAAESAKQTLGSLAQDFVAKQNQKDAWNQAIQSAKFRNADNMAALNTMANNFGIGGTKEYTDWVNNPNDENLAKLQKAAGVKFK